MMMEIPLFKIHWNEDDIEAVNSIIRSGTYWCVGRDIEEFEQEIARYLGPEHCVLLNSGGSALQALMVAHDFQRGDEIIVPSFTFIASAYAPLYVGATPVFGDIEEDTYGLDAEDVKQKISRNTKAILPVHYGGMPCRINALRDLAEDHDLVLIEDAAQALGAKYGGKSIGTFGHSSIFSFCQNKVITTSEGGCIVTDDNSINEKVRLFRSYGRVISDDYFAGLQGLSELEEVSCPVPPSDDFFTVYQMFTIRVRTGQEERDALMKHLGEKGISSKVYFDPVHKYSVFQKLGYDSTRLPVTEKIASEVLTIPMYPHMTNEELDYLSKSISEFF
jgi:perosamine synthetase